MNKLFCLFLALVSIFSLTTFSVIDEDGFEVRDIPTDKNLIKSWQIKKNDITYEITKKIERGFGEGTYRISIKEKSNDLLSDIFVFNYIYSPVFEKGSINIEIETSHHAYSLMKLLIKLNFKVVRKRDDKDVYFLDGLVSRNDINFKIMELTHFGIPEKVLNKFLKILKEE